MRVGIHYGLDHADFEVEESNLVGFHRQSPAPPIADLGKAVQEALETPHGFPALRKALTPDDHVVIVTDDKLPHQEEMLSAIVEYLMGAGIRPWAITILYPSQASPAAKLSGHPEVRIEVHNPSNRKKLSYLATTRRGRRLYLNRTAIDADQLIVLAGGGYDLILGYSGTVGALFPGLSDEETKQQISADLKTAAPDGQPWPVRREAEEVAWLLGAPFMVQVIGGSRDEIIHVLGGLADAADEGHQLLDARWRVNVERRADVVVASVAGDPNRHTFADLAQGLASAARVVRSRGRIVLLTQAQPTLGPGAEMIRQADEPNAILTSLRLQKPPDLAAAFQWASAADHADISLLSRLEPDTAEELFTTPLSDVAQVQHLLNGAATLFLEDAHKTMAVVDAGT